MKKNNKGMTLVELIVSFMIVAVAMLYFFQTLRMVQKLYVKAVKQTDEYVEKEYAIRLLDEYLKSNSATELGNFCNSIYTECSEVIYDNPATYVDGDSYAIQNNSYNKYVIKKDGNDWVTLYEPSFSSVTSLHASGGASFRPSFTGFYTGCNLTPKNNVITASWRGTEAKYAFNELYEGSTSVHVYMGNDCGSNTNTTTIQAIDLNTGDILSEQIVGTTSDTSWQDMGNITISHSSKYIIRVVVKHSDAVDACSSYTSLEFD